MLTTEAEMNQEYTRIEGTVENIVFLNEENGYIVLDLDTGDELTTVVGELGPVDEGEELRLTGAFVDDPRFGEQFRAVACERKLPATESAILKYLASGTVKGVGKTLAKRIVAEFGDKSLEVIEQDWRRLADVKGVSESKAEEIHDEFMRINGVRSLMSFLSGYGISPADAMTAWKTWGQFAQEMIKSDPFVLCEAGVDFPHADRISADLGLPGDSPERIRAGVEYIIRRNTDNGHTCVPTDKLSQKASEFLQVPVEKITLSRQEEIEEKRLYEYDREGRSFSMLPDYERAESYIASRLNMMNTAFKDNGTDYTELIDIEEQTKKITYAEKQREAISLALSKGFLILTGGPGTGKTTTLKAIISLFEQRGAKVMLAAPTGRAAKRLSDLTDRPAKTIHRMLEVAYGKDGTARFVHNERSPLSCDVCIVDEMSMVDTLLFEALLKGLRFSCRLIMVGDSDQLPSVGAGNVLRDMIDSGTLSVVSLTEIFRQAAQSLIITNAHRIVSGQMPELSRTDNDFFFMPMNSPRQAAQTVGELCAQRLPKAYKYSPLDDIQVLCPSRKGLLGTGELNKLLQEAVNPPGKGKYEIKSKTFTFRDGDKVMQCRNNYEIEWMRDSEKGEGIFNGDIGTIIKVNRAERAVFIDFEGRIAKYSSAMLDEIEPAYAVTVHKSQGNEFNAVILPLMDGFEKLYYRNLLYTAVTRAKKQLIIVGSLATIRMMVENDRRTLRYTTLRERLIQEQDIQDDG